MTFLLLLVLINITSYVIRAYNIVLNNYRFANNGPN